MARERSEGQDRFQPHPWIAAMVAIVFVLVAVIVIVYDVARAAPPGYECGDAEPAGHAARTAAFRDGSVTWHGIAILWCLGTLLALSAARCASRERGGPIGLPTMLGAGLAAIVLAIGLGHDMGVLIGVPAVLVGGPALLLAHPGAPVGLALLAVLLLLGAGAFAWINVADRRLVGVSAVVWWLGWFAAGHLLLVQAAGDGPYFC